MVDPKQVLQEFRDRFHGTPRLFSAPGRVNLIGEHTDYNEGFVLPVTINHNTIAAASASDDHCLRIYSANYKDYREFDLTGNFSTPKGDWLRYVEGVARLLEKNGHAIKGGDVLVRSDIPVGAGLSSSAALEVALGVMFLSLAGDAINGMEIVLTGQQTEHQYIGTNSGIMDQFISMFGKHDTALLIDCRSNTAEYVPIDTKDIAIVICDSRVKHDLATSAYNDRRKECEKAVETLQKYLPDVKSLRDVSFEEFKEFERRIPQPACKRARHVITENERTLQAAEALRRNNFDDLKELMRASHNSLRDDYEVSIRELDVLVDAAYAIDGTVGARMTGGGFGGCTVNLVRREMLDDFQEMIRFRYRQQTGKETDIYISEVVDGAKELTLE